MLSTTTSQSPSVQRNLPIPMDGRCIVVQMPSMEEMRREVADITCQMQSVYLEDEVNLDPTEIVTNNHIQVSFLIPLLSCQTAFNDIILPRLPRSQHLRIFSTEKFRLPLSTLRSSICIIQLKNCAITIRPDFIKMDG